MSERVPVPNGTLTFERTPEGAAWARLSRTASGATRAPGGIERLLGASFAEKRPARFEGR